MILKVKKKLEVYIYELKKILVGVSVIALCCSVTLTPPAQSVDVTNSVVASAEDVEPTLASYFKFSCDSDYMTATVTGYSDAGPTDVVIPSTVTYKDEVYTVTAVSGFAKNTYITSVVIPDTVLFIQHTYSGGAFEGCKSLKSVTLSKNFRSIGDNSFNSCTSLTSIEIPDSVTKIEYSAFENCTSLESVTIPDNVVEVGKSTFRSCNSLKEATIGDGITEISESMFNGCSSLESVTLSSNTTSIGWLAFSGCEKLTSITLPTTLSSIVYNAFDDCISLANVYYEGSEDEWSLVSTNNALTDPTITYIDGTLSNAKIKGDLNGDGEVNLLDLLKLKKYLLGIIDNLE